MTTDPGSLEGVGVLVTRPVHQAGKLVHLIDAAGGQAFRLPTIEIQPPDNPAELNSILARLDQYQIAIFISANAVTTVLKSLTDIGAELPAKLSLACIGPSGVRILEDAGYSVEIVPNKDYRSETLLATASLQSVSGKGIVIFRGQGGRKLLAQTLRDRGAMVEYADCYKRVCPNIDTSAIMAHWKKGDIAIFIATSVEGLKNLIRMTGENWKKQIQNTPVVVVSERIRDACYRLGFQAPILLAPSARDEHILATLKTWRQSEKTL